MTFVGQETSIEAGRPVELYTFSSPLETLRYTSADDDQVVSGNTYAAIAISRGSIAQGRETRSGVLEITMPADETLPRRYVASAPSARVTVTIQRFHRGDGELATFFSGRLKSVSFGEDGRVAKLAIDPPVTATARQIPRFKFSGLCNNVLGDGAGGGSGLCTVDLEDPAYKLTAAVSAASGMTITVPGAAAFGDGWFAGGTVRTSAGTDARLVIDHTGDVLTLHIPFTVPVVGETVTVRAGCDRSPQTCSGKFDHFDEFQGQPWVPRRNPFEGIDPDVC